MFSSSAVLLMFFSSTFVANNQDSLRAKYFNNIGVAVFFSPDNTSSHMARGVYASPFTIAKPGFGYTTGINGIYYIKKGWGIQTGLCYSEWQYTAMYDFYWSKDSTLASKTFVFNYYSIPLNIRYTFFIKRFSVFLYTGLSRYKVKKALESRRYYDSSTRSFTDTDFGEITNHETTKYAHTAGIGISFKLTKNLDVFLNPELRMMRREHAFMPRRLHSLGCNAGLSYLF